ncbi:hypothetical protein GYMLUDRAFT_43029 [Collybiopsis luxurians FD-317 M1]|uniref:Uncharacterized protein n=1 Tax=Collybiopsis luxurians FD-317 M1 TaxID=944289 RepID=A0A0D0CYL1_9AGAR|nr:hypothetical protein GYMLUDRAFT_43029 [Collybiopsis luxurians FD-317 M1]
MSTGKFDDTSIMSMDDDDLKAALTDAGKTIRKSAAPKSEQPGQTKGSDRLESTIEASQGAISTAQEAAPGTDAALQALQPELDKLSRYSEFLMSALDGLQQIHPFVAPVVLAFKAGMKLEITRRENDKRVLTVRISMNDLFNAILLIKDIPAGKRGRDGLSIESRLRERITKIAHDITECWKVCDTFQNKRKIVKFFRSWEWEKNFEELIAMFKQNREDIQEDLSLYISIEAKHTHDTLFDISKSIQTVGHNMSMALLLQLLRSPEERKLQEFIKSKGGPEKFLINDDLMRELIKRSGEQESKLSSGKEKTDLTQEIKREISKTVKELISGNFELFLGKFEAQQKQLQDHIEASVRIEGEKTRNAMQEGPHKLINDPDLSQIWKDMGWKSAVKARSMAIALREYYSERRKDLQSRDRQSMESIAAIVRSEDETETDKIRGIAEIVGGDRQKLKEETLKHAEDDWALEYITISRIQPLLEALDDDSSSLISVAEVNDFTAARPTNWSLPKWMAFWTAGFPLTLKHYYTHIQLLLWFIEYLVPYVPQVNSQIVKAFVTKWPFTSATDQLLAGMYDAVDDIYDNNDLFQRFKEYMDSEEGRMQKTLQTLKYRIDAENTLRLITGPGRLDKYIMALIYLLFVRVYQIVRCAMTTAVDPKEVDDITGSFEVIHEAIGSRVDSLKAVCKLQNLDLKVQLRKISYGIFYYVGFGEDLPRSKFWTTMYTNQRKPPSMNTFQDDWHDMQLYAVSDPDVNDVNAIPSGKLFYSVLAESLNVEPNDDTDDFANLLPLNGSITTAMSSWCGFFTDHSASNTKYPAGVIYLPLPENVGFFSGSGSDSIGEFSIAGKVDGEAITFNKRYTSGKVATQRYEGKLNVDRNQMLGGWGRCDTEQEDFSRRLDSTEVLGQFELHTAPLGIRRFVKVDADLASSSPREKWRFAISTVITLLHIKRREFPGWTYLQNRRKIRRRFIELFPRVQELPIWGVYDPLSNEEMEELCMLVSYCSRQDLRFYRSLSACLQRRVVVHWRAWCDSGSQDLITNTRFVCLDCLKRHPVNGELSNPIDLCDDCIDKSVDRISDDMHHIPSHDMLQLRYCCSFRRQNSLLEAALHIAKKLRGEDAEDAVSRICHQCQSTLKRPYWYCLACPDNKCICMACKDQLDNNYSPVLDLKLFYASDTPVKTVDPSGENMEDADGTNANETNGMEDTTNEDASTHLDPGAVHTPGTNNGGEEMETLPVAITSNSDDVDRAAQDGDNIENSDKGGNGEKMEGEVENPSEESNEDSGSEDGHEAEAKSDNIAGADENNGAGSAQEDTAETKQQSVEHIYGHTLILCRAIEESPPKDDGPGKPSVEEQLADLSERLKSVESMESRIMERLEHMMGRLFSPGTLEDSAPSPNVNGNLPADA